MLTYLSFNFNTISVCFIYLFMVWNVQWTGEGKIVGFIHFVFYSQQSCFINHIFGAFTILFLDKLFDIYFKPPRDGKGGFVINGYYPSGALLTLIQMKFVFQVQMDYSRQCLDLPECQATLHLCTAHQTLSDHSPIIHQG